MTIITRSCVVLALALSLGGAGCNCSSTDQAQDSGTFDATSIDSAVDATSDTDSGETDASATIADAQAADAANDRSDAGFVIGCESAACDLIDNGCAANKACYYLPAQIGEPPQPVCAARGDNSEGSICTTQEQCAPGLGCDPSNRCRNYCCAPGESTGCPTGQACLLEFRDNDDQSLGVGQCQACDACDPIDSNGCGTGQGCYPATSDGACTLCTTPRVNGNVGATCSTSSDCRPGLGCIGSATPRCAKFCSVAGGDDCNGSETCRAIGYTDLPDLGSCQAP